jgi:chromosome segregation ATPase
MFHVHHHYHIGSNGDTSPPWDEIKATLAEVLVVLGRIEAREVRLTMNVKDIQAKADDTLAKVTADADVSNAVKTVVTHQNDVLAALQQQITDLQASNDPAALQKLSDTLDAIKSAETSNAQSVADAVTAGTPVAAPPAPPAS